MEKKSENNLIGRSAGVIGRHKLACRRSFLRKERDECQVSKGVSAGVILGTFVSHYMFSPHPGRTTPFDIFVRSIFISCVLVVCVYDNIVLFYGEPKMKRPVFNPANGMVGQNFDLILAFLTLPTGMIEFITNYKISSEGKTSEKSDDPGEDQKYIALFLYYLSTVAESTCFTIPDDAVDEIWKYFGNITCWDALQNPNTRHKGLKALLGHEPVIELEIEPSH